MNDEMASDWLASALAEFQHLPDSAFMAGVTKARRTCTHHAQIVPTVLDEAAKAQARTTGAVFLDDWHEAMVDYANDFRPRITDKSKAQKLIESAAKGCKA
jgi:hypothetical protein